MDNEHSPIILLEKKNSLNCNDINSLKKDFSFDNLSKTLKEMEQLINSIPKNEDNVTVIESLKEKINICYTQISDLQKSTKIILQNQIENQNLENNNQNNIDNKMDLMLNKIDIIIKMINSNQIEELNSEEIKEKIYENGDKYIGQFKNGKKHGKGKMFYSDKNYYDGEWFNDLKMGQGKLTLANGDIYEGTFKNNLMEGYGNYTYKNGRIYEGQFISNLMEGKGRYKFPTGNEYIGDFQKGLFNGKGTFLYSNGDRFEGMYKNGKKNGNGIYYFKSGEKYIGEWVKDERHGEGVLTRKNGKEERQYFENGKLKTMKNSKILLRNNNICDYVKEIIKIKYSIYLL